MPPSGVEMEFLPIYREVRNVPVRLQLIRVDLDYRVLYLDSHSTCESRKRHGSQGHPLAQTWTPISLVIAPYRALMPALQKMVTHARVGQLLLAGCARPATLTLP